MRGLRFGLFCMVLAGAIVLPSVPAAAQIDEERAALFFEEARTLCERDGGRLWGVSLCGPMVFGDPVTRSIATNQDAPSDPRPPFLGFANSIADWGGTRWSTFVWPMIAPIDEHRRARLMLHELFHRVQAELGLMTAGSPPNHLDTLDGRYWVRLEWRALAQALGSSGEARTTAIRDALAFRRARRQLFPDAAANERPDEIREGLAQYTGAVLSTNSLEEANASAIQQLSEYEQNPTFVATFGYPTGTAYGLLLDAASPGWTRRLRPEDDLGVLLQSAAGLQPADDATVSASRYGGPELRLAEEKREAEQNARIADFRRRFVDGPVLILPGVRSSSSVTNGRTVIPNAGTIYPTFRTTAEWGSLEAEWALVPDDRSTVVVPAPAGTEGSVLRGDGWTLTLASGWVVRPGSRSGDFEVVPEGWRSLPQCPL